MGILLLVLAGTLYLLPTIVALNNKKSNSGSIFVLNLLLGWMLIPWVISLVWAVAKDRKPDIVQVFDKSYPDTLGYTRGRE